MLRYIQCNMGRIVKKGDTRNSMKYVKAILVCALAGVVLAFSACQKQPEEPAQPDEIIMAPEETPAAEAMPTPSPTPGDAAQAQIVPTATPDDSDLNGVPDPGETPVPASTLEDYQKKNKDVVGWIKVPDTKIDYPVVMGEDNSYYLKHNVLKKSSKYGAIFMDFNNKEKAQQRHLILYGHHMKDGSMFAELAKYKKEDFFKQNQKITFTWDGKETTWQIFSAHNFHTKTQNLTATAFGSDANFVEYMKGVKELSDFKNDVTVGKGDQVLTLLTCTYEYDDARYVVHFKKVKS